MNRNLAIVLSVFIIMYFGALIIASDSITFEIPFASEVTGINNIVELKDGISILDSATVEVPHPLIGTLQTSEDGLTCWEVTEKIGVLYYKIMGECPENV